MKTLFIILIFCSFQTLICQVDSSALKQLEDNYNNVKNINYKITLIKIDVLRYQKLLKNKDITISEFNDLINGKVELLQMMINQLIPDKKESSGIMYFNSPNIMPL